VRRHRRKGKYWLYSGLVVGLFVAAAWWTSHPGETKLNVSPFETPAPAASAGDLITVDKVEPYTAQAATVVARQNYGAAAPPVATGITKVTFQYRSKQLNGEWTTIYGRAYLPAEPASNLPIFAFAPGTTGIGDKCAASLEQVKIANWANYDSHMMMYAGQGFAAVTTDYEGMRDPKLIHHYMIGELEGRAVLDAVRALGKLPQAKDRLSATNIFVSGYSQGGHAAFWADKINLSYAPEVKLRGVIGFNPVMSVKQTMADVTRGANINWFGPYVMYSYRDHYRSSATSLPIDQMLVPKVAGALEIDVPSHCINTNIAHWGSNPAGVFTPDFLRVMADSAWEGPYAEFGRQLDLNEVGNDPSSTAKRINTGTHDNVVLASHQTTGAAQLCAGSAGPVQQQLYPGSTHYDTMVRSLHDTLAWMRTLAAGQSVPQICPAN
jgi:hypothetical protein